MGYDLHMVLTPTTAPEGYKPQYPGQLGYYRLNTYGMSVTRGFMWEWAEAWYSADAPEFPDMSAFGLREEDSDQVVEWREWHAEKAELENSTDHDVADEWAELGEEPEPPSEEQKRNFLLWEAAYNAALGIDTVKDGQVASYKWESNDGWLVTPAECLTIAAAVRKHADEIAADYFTDIDGMSAADGRDWLNAWIGFHELAATHGGYRVH